MKLAATWLSHQRVARNTGCAQSGPSQLGHFPAVALGRFLNPSKLPVLYLQTVEIITVAASHGHCKDEMKPCVWAQCTGQVPHHSCVTSRGVSGVGDKGGGIGEQEDTGGDPASLITLTIDGAGLDTVLRVAMAVGVGG